MLAAPLFTMERSARGALLLEELEDVVVLEEELLVELDEELLDDDELLELEELELLEEVTCTVV
jgi:hypothetical protein